MRACPEDISGLRWPVTAMYTPVRRFSRDNGGSLFQAEAKAGLRKQAKENIEYRTRNVEL
jgi:hypothetical protein